MKSHVEVKSWGDPTREFSFLLVLIVVVSSLQCAPCRCHSCYYYTNIQNLFYFHNIPSIQLLTPENNCLKYVQQHMIGRIEFDVMDFIGLTDSAKPNEPSIQPVLESFRSLLTHHIACCILRGKFD